MPLLETNYKCTAGLIWCAFRNLSDISTKERREKNVRAPSIGPNTSIVSLLLRSLLPRLLDRPPLRLRTGLLLNKRVSKGAQLYEAGASFGPVIVIDVLPIAIRLEAIAVLPCFFGSRMRAQNLRCTRPSDAKGASPQEECSLL